MLPSNVGTGQVIGTFLNLDGSAGQGTVRFQPVPNPLLADDVIVVHVPPVVATLDADGAFSVELIATDDTDLDPVNWTYRVDVAIIGTRQWTFHITVPEGSTQDLRNLVPVPPSQGTPTSGVVSVNGQTGVVVLVASDVGADVEGAAANALAAANAYTDTEIAGVVVEIDDAGNWPPADDPGVLYVLTDDGE